VETSGLFAENFNVLEKAMDLRAYRHQILVSNIANKETPHYKAFDVALNEALSDAAGRSDAGSLRQTHPAHLSGAGAAVPAGAPVTVQDAAQNAANVRGDGNTVDLDREMLKMSENGIAYSALTQVASREFLLLKSVIEGK